MIGHNKHSDHKRSLCKPSYRPVLTYLSDDRPIWRILNYLIMWFIWRCPYSLGDNYVDEEAINHEMQTMHSNNQLQYFSYSITFNLHILAIFIPILLSYNKRNGRYIIWIEPHFETETVKFINYCLHERVIMETLTCSL